MSLAKPKWSSTKNVLASLITLSCLLYCRTVRGTIVVEWLGQSAFGLTVSGVRRSCIPPRASCLSSVIDSCLRVVDMVGSENKGSNPSLALSHGHRGMEAGPITNSPRLAPQGDIFRWCQWLRDHVPAGKLYDAPQVCLTSVSARSIQLLTLSREETCSCDWFFSVTPTACTGRSAFPTVT